MKNCLLFLAVVAALMVGVPAHSQMMFLDVDGDGLSSEAGQGGNDVLTPSTTSVDVYYVTDTNPDGSTAVCNNAGTPDPTFPLTIFGYEFIMVSSGTGSVAYGTWTDNTGFNIKTSLCGSDPYCTGGGAIWIGWTGTTPFSPGKYKVGTLAVTVTGFAKLDFVPNYPSLNPNALTDFGTNCPGELGLATYMLGIDFPTANAYGTAAQVDVVPTTWGKIKDLYR
jgi:hypothetical protein